MGRSSIMGTSSILSSLQDAMHRSADALAGVMPWVLAIAVIFTVAALWPGQRCNADRPWWRNCGLVTDACYCFLMPLFAPYVRIGLLSAGATVIVLVIGGQRPDEYLLNGGGILGRLGFPGQLAVYVILSDFLLYWSHRLFHGSQLWRYHAVHHSATDVDWTTAYRSHPVNLWCGPVLVTTAMILLGIAPVVLAFWTPFDMLMAAFVHANLKWTLGPLKYVVASPVFHRWHHTYEACEKNYGSSLALWDVMFGTFFMPPGCLPVRYGVADGSVPEGFLLQLAYPFRAASSGDANAAAQRPTGAKA